MERKRVVMASFLLFSFSSGIGMTGEDPPQGDTAPDTWQEQAFKSALKTQMPLTPENMMDLHKELRELQKAAGEQGSKEPEFLSHLQTIVLEPGAAPPHIYVETGYVSVLSIIDVTGQPWPVKNYVIGNPKQFDIQGPLSEGHILTLSPLSRYGSSNLSVTLEGLPTPLMFVLRSGQDKVHTRYDARIPKTGPLALPPLIEKTRTYEAGDETLMAFLQGVPPQGAQRYTLKGETSSVRVWGYQGKMYVRSPWLLLSPAPEARVCSSDGTSVYRLSPLPVLMFSRDGGILKVIVDLHRGNP